MRSLTVKTIIMIITIGAPNLLHAHTEMLVVDSGRPALSDCKIRSAHVPRSDDQPRVNAIFSKIYSANLKSFRQISKGPSDFCILALEEPRIDARADVQTGQIYIFKGLSKQVHSEEGMAAIIAHEAAHILLYATDPIPFNLRATESEETVALLRATHRKHFLRLNARADRQAFVDEIKETQIIKALKNEKDPSGKAWGMNVISKLKKYQSIPMGGTIIKSHPLITDDSFYSDFIRLGETYGISSKRVEASHKMVLDFNAEIGEMEQSLSSKLGSKFSPKIFSNFVEREADEVGFELYVRAGYDPEKYDEGLLSIIAAEMKLRGTNEARRHCEDQAKKGLVTEGDESHPSICFRIENIKQELIKHRDYYDRIHSAGAEERSRKIPY